MTNAERHRIGLAIIGLLPDNAPDALTVLVMVLANVSVSAECGDEALFKALRTALQQRRRVRP